MTTTGDGRADMALKNLVQQLYKAANEGRINDNEYERALTLITDLHTILRGSYAVDEESDK